MILKEFKEHIENLESGKVLKYSVSHPFSWRGSYNEVAFEIKEEPMSRESILANIEEAYEGIFIGYKGGEYTYNDNTDVNFEEDTSCYTDGGYCARIIATIEDDEVYETQEMRLVKLAFK